MRRFRIFPRKPGILEKILERLGFSAFGGEMVASIVLKMEIFLKKMGILFGEMGI